MINNEIFEMPFFTGDKKKIECQYQYENNLEKYVIFSNEHIIYESTLQPFGTYWISFFDSKRENFDTPFEVNYMHSLINDFKSETISLFKGDYLRFLSKYKLLVEFHPYFTMFFPLIYEILYASKTNNNNDEQIEILFNKLLDLSTSYSDYDQYIKDTLLYRDGLICSTGTRVARVESLASMADSRTPYSMRLFSNEQIPLNNLIQGKITNDYDFSLQFPLGIDLFIEKNISFKQCPICKGYFKTNRISNISFCNKIYRNNMTCQEIGANMKYHEKMTSNPVHYEFKKYYNKILGRIKRNNIAKEDAHLEELKQLHKKYEHIYEITYTESDKEKTITAFVAEMDSLFKTNTEKNKTQNP